jgi:hypothetical protein
VSTAATVSDRCSLQGVPTAREDLSEQKQRYAQDLRTISKFGALSDRIMFILAPRLFRDRRGQEIEQIPGAFVGAEK